MISKFLCSMNSAYIKIWSYNYDNPGQCSLRSIKSIPLSQTTATLPNTLILIFLIYYLHQLLTRKRPITRAESIFGTNFPMTWKNTQIFKINLRIVCYWFDGILICFTLCWFTLALRLLGMPQRNSLIIKKLQFFEQPNSICTNICSISSSYFLLTKLSDKK